MITLFPFQSQAAAEIASRYARFMADRPVVGTQKDPRPLPFYQALSSITASGKTAILAETIAQIEAGLPVKPVVMWLSRGKVVVEQTYKNLSPSGKYHHLIQDFDVRLLSQYKSSDVEAATRGLIYFATVGTFNQKDKEKGDRLIYRSDMDTAESSVWEALKQRLNSQQVRRPLIVVYDEGHNLSDQQMQLLLELEADAFIVASATLKKPPSGLNEILKSLDTAGWEGDQLIASIAASDVAASGLIKTDLVLGGYAAPMESAIDDLLQAFDAASVAGASAKPQIAPKAVYVSRTNVVEADHSRKDDPKRPFHQREAPPILIWRYLVEQKGITPDEIAVYANLKFDKLYPAPPEFVLYAGGDSDYEQFVKGGYRHVIFNQALQEGWDDPEVYFAYIDRSMGSPVKVEQVIGRLLRQPNAITQPNSRLNEARVFVRVDNEQVFKKVFEEVRGKLTKDAPSVQVSSYESRKARDRETVPPSRDMTIPQLFLDTSNVLELIQTAVDNFVDFRQDTVNTRADGSMVLVQQRVGGDAASTFEWVKRDSNSTVSARWLFQLRVMRQYPRVLEVTPSDDPKFDALVQLGSTAHKSVEALADACVRSYMDAVRLKVAKHNPFRVGEAVNIVDDKMPYPNSLHGGYSGLNSFERACAAELESAGVLWARNPSRTGYPIPLPSLGSSRNFYPDFLVWKNGDVFAIDTTGDHLMKEKSGRKLMSITSPPGVPSIHVCLISEGRWNPKVEKVGKEGYTVWGLQADGNIQAAHVDSMAVAVAQALTS
ncbi:hypothetical protein DVS28_a2073 [Euzebya pacifica]|uniref:Helicase/UvrB N-terminal domain-containing protein n=1 Tax=Euzebya pacifica TaxID=1608957 RepID=A0A346XX11_9ACTN|nr:DEAD/DEAH box helicase family protein [Euzebya pacifica]AXV06758.1 hypothetical protein DVS28_a2073 [Euzebya pacifica]